MRIIILLTTLATLSSCNCVTKDIKYVQVTQARDKYLSCEGLKKEMLEAEFQIRANLARLDDIDAYSRNPACIPATSMDIDKARSMAENRAMYLQMLYEQKKCDGAKN